MRDPRLQAILDAVRAMRDGRLDVSLPTGDDDLGELGAALTELRRELVTRQADLRALVAVTAKINAGLVLDEVMDQIYESFRTLIPYDRLGVALIEDGTRVVTRWAHASGGRIDLGPGYSAPLAGSSLALLLASGEPRILNDLEAYLAAHPQSESTRFIVAEGIRSSLTCPLLAAGKPIGFLFFSSRERGTYERAHVELFQEIAGQVAITIEKGQLYAQLVQANEAKNRLLGIVAHDLRNPAAVVRGYVGLLLGDAIGPLAADQRDVLERVDRAVERALRLIHDLVDLSAVTAGRLDLRRAPIAAGALLAGCADAAALLARAKGIRIVRDLPAELPAVLVYRDRVEQVAANLPDNAIKFSPSGRTITLRARAAGRFVSVEVIDEGPGIPVADLPRLFAEFTRGTARPTAGERSTGLGLAISWRLVHEHGGALTVASRPDVGTTFTFTLPIAPTDP